jgi:hypothetical protein
MKENEVGETSSTHGGNKKLAFRFQKGREILDHLSNYQLFHGIPHIMNLVIITELDPNKLSLFFCW